MKSSVFVNGTYAGGHIYGYTPFEVDISALVYEGENEILVRVDNSMQPGSRWYSGSGITRDVWLEKRHPIHIARYGMYLTTDEGNLNISTTPVSYTHLDVYKRQLRSTLGSAHYRD